MHEIESDVKEWKKKEMIWIDVLPFLTFHDLLLLIEPAGHEVDGVFIFIVFVYLKGGGHLTLLIGIIFAN